MASAEPAADRRLDRAVAVTVVVLSSFMAVSKVKDDNIVQAMQQAKADAVDTWSEYQAAKLKQHQAEGSVRQATLFRAAMAAEQRPLADQVIADEQARIAKYADAAKQLEAKARGFEQRYDALNLHDDQFDLSDALLSVAMAVVGMSALVELWSLLAVGWAFGALGIAMGVAGFVGGAFHLDWAARLLG